jgi:predicted Zn finger-like uncharacterized protein
MLIVCPSCATSYDVEAATLPPHGRRVRCVRCRNIWLAEPSHADKLLAAAKAIAPVRQMAEVIDSIVAETPAETVAGPQHDLVESTIRQAEDGDSLTLPSDSPDPSDGAASTTEDGASGEPAAEIDAPPIAPADPDDGQPPIEIEAEPPPEDIETYAARQEKLRAKRQSWRWPLSNLQNGVLALLIIDAVLVGWRDEFVRILPQTAAFYSTMGLGVNLRGLAFDGITTSTEQHDGVPILVVAGNIVNDGSKLSEVPRLKFAVRNPSGQEVYSWTAAPPRATLPPGETVAFRSRLASPPQEAHDVLVRFITRRDIAAGVH